jgi:hypothetical protein
MASDKENEEPRYYGEERGTVTRNDDPLMIGRVKARIAGLMEETEWALPKGGGSAQRGRWQVPPVGADVTIYFHRGDPHGYASYDAGNWGSGEAPTFITSDPTVTPEDAWMLSGFEDERFYVVLDSRPGKQAARVVDKVSGDKIELDGNLRRCTVQVTGTVTINAGAIALNGARVLINGRPVSPVGGAIG